MEKRLRVPAVLVTFIMFTSIMVAMFAPSVGAVTFTPSLDLYSEAVYLVNMDTDSLIFEKNAYQQYTPASLVKIMTAIVALEETEDLEEMVTAPAEVFDEIYGKNASNCNMLPGEEMRMIDLLYGLMLKSGCDAAGTIAYHVGGGDQDKFVEMMNNKAKEIGAVDTNFTDSHGLDGEGQMTTAYDMYLISKYALGVEGFEEIATTYYYECPPTNKRGENNQTRYWTHTNRLMDSSSDYYNEYVTGGKTATSTVGTRNLLTTAQKDGTSYMLIVMGAPSRDDDGNTIYSTFRDSNDIFEWLFEDFSMRTVVNADTYVTEVPVALSAGNEYVLAVPEKEVQEFLPKLVDLDQDIDYEATIQEDVTAPIQKGDIIGVLELSYKGQALSSVNLVASEGVDRSTWKYILDVVKRFFQNTWVRVIGIILLLLILLYIFLIVFYNRKKRRRRKRYQNRARRI